MGKYWKTLFVWPALGCLLGATVWAVQHTRPAQAGPTWNEHQKTWVTETPDGLRQWRALPNDQMQVTEHYLAEYLVPSSDKATPPRVEIGVFRRVYKPAPKNAEPLRRYSEVHTGATPSPIPAPVPPPSCGGGSCGGGGGACG